jgi:hypothetical protein
VASEATYSKRDPALVSGGRPIRLAAGAHSSPRNGVCVVELASVIAAEKFSDRPRCVCPVIGAFLRGWNDRAPYAERQRLGPYAELIVGSRGTPRVTHERRDACLEWAGVDLTGGPGRSLLARAEIRLRIAILCGLGGAVRFNEGAGDYASRVAWTRRDTASAFELLDTLLAIGRPPADAPLVAVGVDVNGNGNGNGHRNGNGNGNGRPVALGPISRGVRSRPEHLPEHSESEEPSRART